MNRFYSYTETDFRSDLALHKPTLQYIDDQFYCSECQYHFTLKSPLNIFKYRGASGCPHCNPGAFKQSDFESYSVLLKDKGLVSARPILKLDSTEYEFRCLENHTFQMRPRNALTLNECPECKKIKFFYGLFTPLINDQLTLKTPPLNWNSSESFEVTCILCNNSRRTNIKALRHLHAKGSSPCSFCNQTFRKEEFYSSKLSERSLNSDLTLTDPEEFTHYSAPLTCKCSACGVIGKWTISQLEINSHGCPSCNKTSVPVRTKSDATNRILSLFPDTSLEMLDMSLTDNLTASSFTLKHDCGYSQEYSYSRLINMKGLFKCPGCSPINSNKYSAASLLLNKHLKTQYPDLVYQDKRYQLKEKLIRCGNTKYYLDAYSPSNNSVIEFHGDKFHGNPKLYPPENNCHPFNKQTAGELYQLTTIKEQFIRNSGYRLATIWEADYWNMSWKEVDAHIFGQLEKPLTLGEFFIYGRGYYNTYKEDRSLIVAQFDDPEIPKGLAYKAEQSFQLSFWIYPSTSPEKTTISPLKIEIHESSDKVTSFWCWDDGYKDYFLYFCRTELLNRLELESAIAIVN